MTERNVGIDLFRLLGALAVVAIHVGNVLINNMNVESIVMAITSFAVPYFFLVSGYFFSTKKGLLPLLRYFGIYCTALLIYSLIHVSQLHFSDVLSLVRFLIAPVSIARHLWFLVALMLGWGFLYFIRNEKYRGGVCVVILFVGLLGEPVDFLDSGVYSLLYPHLLAIPFMYVGYRIKNYKGNLKVNNYIIIVCIVGIIIEALLVNHFDHKSSQFYLFTYIFSIVIFCRSLCVSTSNHLFLRLAMLGRDYSLFIYLYHLLIIEMIFKLFVICTSSSLSMFLFWIVVSIFVFFSTLCLGIVLKNTVCLNKLWTLVEGRWMKI